MISQVATDLSGVGWARADHPPAAHLWMASRRGDTESVVQLLREVKETEGCVDKILEFHWGCVGTTQVHEPNIMEGGVLACRHDVVCTPLFIASLMGHWHVVGILVGSGADFYNTCNTGLTPLHVAAYMGHEDVMCSLVKWGMHVDSLSATRTTPLHEAARSGQSKLVLILIELGADVRTRDMYGKLPIDYGRMHGHQYVVNILVANGRVSRATTATSRDTLRCVD